MTESQLNDCRSATSKCALSARRMIDQRGEPLGAFYVRLASASRLARALRKCDDAALKSRLHRRERNFGRSGRCRLIRDASAVGTITRWPGRMVCNFVPRDFHRAARAGSGGGLIAMLQPVTARCVRDGSYYRQQHPAYRGRKNGRCTAQDHERHSLMERSGELQAAI